MPEVWINTVVPSPQDVAARLATGIKAVGRWPRRGERWAVKLNLTYPTHLAGVVNAPAFVEGLCLLAADCGLQIEFVEGDGGNGTYSAEDTFAGNGVVATARRYGMRCVSMSEKPWDWRETTVLGKRVRLPYSPYFERREFDRLVTAPLFKNHIFTVVTLGMKNLWGCIPDAYRMYYHHVLDHGIVALYKELRPDFSIFDGLVAMRGRGPIDGTPLEMNTLMVSSDTPTGEIAALEIMGAPIHRVRHLELAREEGLLPAPVQWLTDPSRFRRNDFVLERTWLNHLSIRVAAMPWLQRIIYHSALSPYLYRAVNRLRGDSAQTRLYRARHGGAFHSIDARDRAA